MPDTFDYGSRLAALEKRVAAAGLAAFIVTSQDSIFYLTGATYVPLERPFFIILYPEGRPTFLVPRLEEAHMGKARGMDRVESYWEYPSRPGEGWLEKLEHALGDRDHVGVEPGARAEIIEALKGRAPRVMGLVDAQRLVKSGEEIASIRRAAAYADLGMAIMCRSLYEGVSPLEMYSAAGKLQTRILRDGAFDSGSTEILTACWPAPVSAQPHSVPRLADRVGAGPAQNMSFLRVSGYAAECERTVFVKKPSKREVELFALMTEARKAAFAIIRPGMPCADVDAAANGYLRDRGLGPCLLHRVGHGIGLSNHEGPWLSEGSTDILAANMVVSVEPGIYLSELGGFRHSDTVLVTGTGCEVLTRSPTALEELVFTSPHPLRKAKGRMIRKALGF